jgi:hypothetical protein
MIMGNIMATVMSFSLYSFSGNMAINGMSVLFAFAIYFSLVAVPAYKDGMDESQLLQSKRVESVPKYRWLGVGAILFAVMLIPNIALLNGFNIGLYRLICGAVNPLVGFINEPLVFIGVYTLTAVACHVGFLLGLGNKLSKDNIMYK